MSAAPSAADDRPTALSLFSGVGGFDLGLERAGWRIAGQCELDPWRRRVLAERFPGVSACPDIKLLGTDPEWPIPDVDLVCGGFPCQDLSVAGRRRGLAGERSGLFFEFARVADRALRPGGLVFIENVPGLLSSHGGRDFAVLLASLAELGFHDLAWRVMDSRFFGVPQRRRRVYIVGRRTRGSVCAEVLLEPDGSARDSAAGRSARARASARARGGADRPGELAATLTSSGNHESRPGRQQSDEYNLVTNALTAERGFRLDPTMATYLPVPEPADHRGVSAAIDRGELTGALTSYFGKRGTDLPDAEANWLVPEQADTLGGDRNSAGGHRLDLDSCGAYPVARGTDEPVRPGEPAYSVRTANTGANGWGVGHDEVPTLDGGSGPAVLPGGRGDRARGSRHAASERREGPERQAGQPHGPAADGVREGAGSAPRGGRRIVEGGDGGSDAERLRGRSGEIEHAGDGAGVGDPGGEERPRSPERDGERAEGAGGRDGEGRRGTDGAGASGSGATPHAHRDGAPAGLPRRVDRDREVAHWRLGNVGGPGAGEVSTDDAVGAVQRGAGPTGSAGYAVARLDQLDDVAGQPPAVGPVEPGDVDVYALRGREGGLQAEATELPNLVGKVGKDGGGMDGFVHDRRGEPEAFLPRHFTRGKDGAPDSVVPPITADSDRGDGMAMVHDPSGEPVYGFQSTLGSLNADGVDEDRSPPVMAATPPAVAYGEDATEVAAESSGDAVMREQLERDGYLPPVPYDPKPDGNRYAAMGDAVTVSVIEWIGHGLRVAVDEPA